MTFIPPFIFFVSSVVFYSLFVVVPLLVLVFALTQLKRLKLRKNNWDSDTYEFDEVLTEFASQKRVYEVVAKPVVEVCCFWCIFFFRALLKAVFILVVIADSRALYLVVLLLYY